MEVRCDKCQARYRVDDARIGPQGLTMRCGKCQNTFRVTRPAEGAAPAASAPKPAAVALKPAPRPAAAKPAASPASAPADEGAGRTMMFQTGNLKPAPAAAKPAGKPAAEPAANATMVFGQSPLAPSKPAMPAPSKPAGGPAGPESGATMVFGQSPLAKQAAPARPAPAARPAPVAKSEPVVEPEPPPEPEAAAPEQPADEPFGEAAPEPTAQDEAAQEEEQTAGHPGVEAEGAEESTENVAPEGSAFDKAPPRGLLIGVAAGLAVLLIAGGALVAKRKLGRHPPPPAAVETLTSAQAEADKDTLASLAAAEGRARDAIDVAGKSYFPQATATLARIEVQWADALNDQAALVTAKGGDGSDAKATALQGQAKARLRAAFDALSPALKADPKSAELQLALADYYRAQRSGSNMNKALKSAQANRVDEDKVAQVQGLALAQEEDGAERAIPKLKAAAAAAPQSARWHFRLALAYQAMKDDAGASAELKQTLKLSPQHERAKLATEMAAASAEGK